MSVGSSVDSVQLGIKAIVLFLISVFLTGLGLTLLSLRLLYASLVAMLVSIASHPSFNPPMILGKNPDGTFPSWARIMFCPYLYFAQCFSPLRRFWNGEAPYSEVCEGLYVGGWPYSPEILPPGNPAIIDCTCELPRNLELPVNAYLCVPTWDLMAPHPEEIESAVQWACTKRAQKIPIFIHCAHGHGRSVTVMCALLVALGVAEDWKSAEKLIEEKRPSIHLNAFHQKALDEWSKQRLSTPKKE